jgi:hypothetical protein
VRGTRIALSLGVMVAALATGCSGAERPPSVDRGSAVGEVALNFTGAVTGLAQGPADVRCFQPAEQGDAFSVSIDADFGIPVRNSVSPVDTPVPPASPGNTPVRPAFRSLDVAAVDYDGPKSYDLGKALGTDDVERDDFFLLFDTGPEPFSWGGKQSDGTLTIDPGESTGRIALIGWDNSRDERIDVNGTFRCGRSPRP